MKYCRQWTLIFLLFLFGICLCGNASVSRAASPPPAANEAKAAEEAKIASGSNPLHFLRDNIKRAWDSGEYDVYLPVNTWHNRLAYDDSKIRSYNEMPWGGGLGRSFMDEDGDSHSLYVMAFMDSHDYVQPIGGYAYIKNWRPGNGGNLALGLGYTLSLTARHEYSYVPLPLPLPLISLQYKQVSLQSAYIPGTKNNGNVLFTWLRLHLDFKE